MSESKFEHAATDCKRKKRSQSAAVLLCSPSTHSHSLTHRRSFRRGAPSFLPTAHQPLAPACLRRLSRPPSRWRRGCVALPVTFTPDNYKYIHTPDHKVSSIARLSIPHQQTNKPTPNQSPPCSGHPTKKHPSFAKPFFPIIIQANRHCHKASNPSIGCHSSSSESRKSNSFEKHGWPGMLKCLYGFPPSNFCPHR